MLLLFNDIVLVTIMGLGSRSEKWVEVQKDGEGLDRASDAGGELGRTGGTTATERRRSKKCRLRGSREGRRWKPLRTELLGIIFS